MKTDKNSQYTKSGTPAQPEQTVPDSFQDSEEHPKTFSRISYEKWFDEYRPIKNPHESNASFDGCLFETYGAELAFVCAQHPHTIWTLLDCDGKIRICEGLHYVNRLGYFVTAVAARNDRYFSIKAD